MGLEAATYIADLNVTNPSAGDPRSQGDDHIRLLKAVLKATFPQLLTYINWKELGTGGGQLSGPMAALQGLVEHAVDLGSGSTIDPYAGNLFYKTLAGAFTPVITPALVVSGALLSFTLELNNGGTARTVNWPASVKWPEGAVPVPSTGIDVYSFYSRDGGATWRGLFIASYVT